MQATAPKKDFELKEVKYRYKPQARITASDLLIFVKIWTLSTPALSPSTTLPSACLLLSPLSREPPSTSGSLPNSASRSIRASTGGTQDPTGGSEHRNQNAGEPNPDGHCKTGQLLRGFRRLPHHSGGTARLSTGVLYCLPDGPLYATHLLALALASRRTLILQQSQTPLPIKLLQVGRSPDPSLQFLPGRSGVCCYEDTSARELDVGMGDAGGMEGACEMGGMDGADVPMFELD
ncbi:hypothetical protein BDK51DRAFT_49403 [Blyttiomyces helicus]|uniref:Uncharacterized protein n=1 Tax=Blyttiomyces helicus TaxID=388810 RepID=A0A4V1IPP3_9FUNG|nr:hypothetical protein BDK51DRAFT_49403 [Blyttiomyces helicus]|eukprot:RKO83757.1 hypothetical protein BDK51DRAFT_49403 [Blyttiomyces helicus]